MQRIRFQPVSNLIVIPIKVMGIDGKSFRDVEVALDTGASTTSIPSYVASALGYNIPNPIDDIITGSGIEKAPIIEIKGLTAIGQTIENIEVVCLDLPPEIYVEGVLGLNFLINFDVHISLAHIPPTSFPLPHSYPRQSTICGVLPQMRRAFRQKDHPPNPENPDSDSY